MKAFKYILALIAILTFSITADCQFVETESDKTVILKLKDGSQLEGDIVEWVNEQYIVIKTSWSPNMKFEMTQVESVIQKSTLNYGGKIALPYNFKEKGIYYTAKATFIVGNDGDRAHARNGFGLSLSGGYRFNRLLGVGLGTGFDQFIWDSGEELIPIFAEVNGFLSSKHTTPFYNLQAGYSIALQDERYLQVDSDGGWMLYPSIGIRFGQQNVKYTIDMGYKFQKARYSYQDVWTSTTISDQTLTYKRLSLRFGVIL